MTRSFQQLIYDSRANLVVRSSNVLYDPDSKAFVGNGRLDDALFRFPFSTSKAAPFWIFGSAGLS